MQWLDGIHDAAVLGESRVFWTVPTPGYYGKVILLPMQDPTTPSESARATERQTEVTEDLVHQMGHGSITEFEGQAVDRCLGMSLSVVLRRGMAPRRGCVNIEGGKRAYKGSVGMSFLCSILTVNFSLQKHLVLLATVHLLSFHRDITLLRQQP